MSNDNDFVNLPLRKQTNRENPLSRIERLEKRTGARSSATAVQLSQISGNTGDLVVDGSIVVINPQTGEQSVVVNSSGVVIVNNSPSFVLTDAQGNTNTIYLNATAANVFEINNLATGGKILLTSTLTDTSEIGLYWQEDSGNANVSHLNALLGTDGGKISIEGEVVIWAGKDGQTTAYNTGGYDIDTVWYDASGNELLRLDAGASSFGGKLTSGTYTPTVTAVTNVDSASADADFMYTRVGNIVQGYGSVSIDPTAGSGTTRIEISLPIASNFAAATDAVGGGSAQVTNTTGSIAADTTDDRLALQFQSPTTASMAWRIWFMYQIL
jgi:hypothetical protein